MKNNVKITQNGRFAKVAIDGVEIHGVVSVDYHIDMETMGTVKLEFYSQEIEIELNKVAHQSPEDILNTCKNLNTALGGTIRD